MRPLPANPTDKLLFTPGPLTTSTAVKQAMLHDIGSWHFTFNERIRVVREQLLGIAGLSRADDWEAILLQGSGTYGVEAVFATCIPANGKVCVLTNGAYGERMIRILKHLQIPHLALRSPESEPPDLHLLDTTLRSDPDITHIAAVHCETSTGILNPIVDIGRLSRRHGCVFVADAMSSFGAVPIDFAQAAIDVLVSSPNKCLEGVPGFCFVLARREMILANEKHARSLSLNLADQLRGFDKHGQFRFTPPTHTLLAFEQALKEFFAEGGVIARRHRYQTNHATLIAGMRQLGFKPFLSPVVQGWIITAFHCPDDSRFRFADFYQRLSEKGFVIYPGKLTDAETFRIANIGHLFEADIRALVAAVAEVKSEMGFDASRVQRAASPLECFQAVPLLL
jgi:2-aminoethylphosphonate-pyruvate transaminase